MNLNGNGTKILDNNKISKGKSLYEMKDEDIALALADEYKKSRVEILELKSRLITWRAVQDELVRLRKSMELTETGITELIKKGFNLQDICIAEELAIEYLITPEEILNIKSNPNFIAITECTQFTDISGNGKEKTWDDVRWQLTVHEAAKRLNVDSAQAKQIENEMLKQNPENKEKTYKNQTEAEKELYQRNGITAEDVSICKQNGIDNSIDIVLAKGLAKKAKTSLHMVAKLKTNKGDWSLVKQELGVSGNEK